MVTKFVSRALIFVIAVFFGMVSFMPAQANPSGVDADLPPYIVVGHCLTDEDVADATSRNDQLWASLLFQTNALQTLNANWTKSYNTEKRHVARLISVNEQLRYQVNHKMIKIAQLRQIIRDLRHG